MLVQSFLRHTLAPRTFVLAPRDRNLAVGEQL